MFLYSFGQPLHDSRLFNIFLGKNSSLLCIFYIAVKYYRTYTLTLTPPHLQLWLKVRDSLYSNKCMFSFFCFKIPRARFCSQILSSFFWFCFFLRMNKVLILFHYTCLNLILAAFWNKWFADFSLNQKCINGSSEGDVLWMNLDRISDDEMFTALHSFCKAFRTNSKCIHDCGLLIG